MGDALILCVEQIGLVRNYSFQIRKRSQVSRQVPAHNTAVPFVLNQFLHKRIHFKTAQITNELRMGRQIKGMIDRSGRSRLHAGGIDHIRKILPRNDAIHKYAADLI